MEGVFRFTAILPGDEAGAMLFMEVLHLFSQSFAGRRGGQRREGAQGNLHLFIPSLFHDRTFAVTFVERSDIRSIFLLFIFETGIRGFILRLLLKVWRNTSESEISHGIGMELNTESSPP
jgi:hypothetical protein